ncbi:MAG TPA: lipopolysaccharide biosynthesis protein [Thermoleophilaceae bacterium]|nr:lipopolysaccharide biosynthesis protein [Thermoleophilaceae bacterium]
MATDPSQSLGTRTLRGMFWAYGSYVGGRVLVLVATAILARILAPADFGLVALGLVFIEVLSTLRDLGVTQALVVVPEEDVEERANTVFTFSVLLGAILTLACVALSPLAAAFFDAPELIGLLSALGATFLVRALGSTHYALAQKRMDFRSRTAGEMADAVLRGVASVAFALAGLGAWSLVLGYIVGSAALTVVLWALVPWRPRLQLRRDHLAPLVRFGGALTGVDIVSAANQNVDYVFVGRVLGAGQLGIYTLAFRLPDLLINGLTLVASSVLFPAYATLSRSELRSAYVRTIQYTVMLTLPVAIGLAILAEPLILATFGDKWKGAVAPMQVLVLYAFFPAITAPPGVIYKAIGRADILLKLALLRVPILVAAIALAVHSGIVAVALCQAGVALLFFFVTTSIATRMLDVGFGPLWTALWPPFAAGAGLAGVLLAVHGTVDSPVPTLLVGTLVGGLAYLGLLWILVPDSLRQLREGLLGSRAPASAG